MAAHPLTEHFTFPLAPVAIWSPVLVLAVGLYWPARRGEAVRGSPADNVGAASWAGTLSRSQFATRWMAVACLGMAIVAGRLGADSDLENPAPAMVVGVAWPLLVLASVVAGAVWRWVDPWDTLARAAARGDQTVGENQVWPAVLVSLPWVWYLSAYPATLDPRSVGTILALYTVGTLAGCVAVGRARWLSSGEPLGIVLGWMAQVPRGRLAIWRPPHGAEALAGVLAGGVLFGAVRRSRLWGELNLMPAAVIFATMGLAVCCLAIAGLFVLAARAGQRRGGREGPARAAVPAVAGIVIAVAMENNRLTTSIQLLPSLLGDPLGRGWNVFGAAGTDLVPAPLGVTGLVVVQIATLVAGHLVGAITLARGSDHALPRQARVPAATALAVLTALSVIAVASP